MTPEQVRTVRGSKYLNIGLRLLRAVAGSGARGMSCEEALADIGVTYQSGSKRFFDLAAVKCIVPNGTKRATEAGAAAAVYVVPDDVSFVPFLSLQHGPRGRHGTGLGQVERTALAAAMKVVHGWPSATSESQRTDLVKRLVKTLVSLSRNNTKQPHA